jgi:LCP family protein required for cell wall assembly
VPIHKIDQQRSQLPKTPHRASWLWAWLGLTGVAMLSAAAGGLLAVSFTTTPLLQRHLTPEEAAVFSKGGSITSNSLRLPELTRPVNVLVMGMSVLTSDLRNRPSDTQPLSYDAQVNSFDGLSDVMLLLRFDPQTEKISVLSIPRDTRVEMDGYGTIKINAANVNGGPAASARLVSQLLDGVQIDRYVRVNIGGVQKLLDALGGVTVYVPKDMKYTDESQHLYIDLKQGRQHLNGDQTLQLLRYRHDAMGDIGRIERQQMLMRALMAQSLNPTTVARLPQILDVIQSHLDTNLSVEELVALVGFSVKTDRSKVQMLMVPGYANGNGRHDVSYWLPDYSRIPKIMKQYFDGGYGTAQTSNRADDSEGQPTEQTKSVRDSSTDSLNDSNTCTDGTDHCKTTSSHGKTRKKRR